MIQHANKFRRSFTRVRGRSNPAIVSHVQFAYLFRLSFVEHLKVLLCLTLGTVSPVDAFWHDWMF